MHDYPAFISLQGKDCLVIGAGKVGLRKIKTLLASKPASILVLDTAQPNHEQMQVLAATTITYEQRSFVPADIAGKFLVIAATTSSTVNERVATSCNQAGILCNIADAPHLSSFIVPSCVRRGDLSFAISTGGHSPALTRWLRQELEATFGEEYEHLVKILGQLRPLLLARNQETHENTAIFRALVESELLADLAAKDLDRAASCLREILPKDMHKKIGELLHGTH